jgi:hypothetical protein
MIFAGTTWKLSASSSVKKKPSLYLQFNKKVVILMEACPKDLAQESQGEILRFAQNDSPNIVILREERPKDLALDFSERDT